VPLELSHRIWPASEVVAGTGGGLDIAIAEVESGTSARSSNGHCGPVVADLTALGFCDAGAWAPAGSPDFIPIA
jgi:hypothetical protein